MKRVTLFIVLALCVSAAGLGSAIPPYATPFARTFLDDPTQADARTTLGLGTGDSPVFAGITVTSSAVLGLNSAVFQPNADSTTFFQVKNAAGTGYPLNVDTTNGRVGIGTNAPNDQLHVYGNAVNVAVFLESIGGATNIDFNSGAAGGKSGFFQLDSSGNMVFRNNDDDIYFDVKTANKDIFFRTRPVTTYLSRLIIKSSGNIGIHETAPETLLELTNAAPYITLHNNTQEDGGRESLIQFFGEQSGGEETTLAVDEANHDGSADDQKGQRIWYTNDGSDGDSPTEGMRLSRGGLSTANDPNTLGVGGTTFVVESNIMTMTGDGAGNTIATITGAKSGMLLTVIFVDGNITITDTDAHTANTVDCAGTATNFTSADDTVLQLVYDGVSWYEVSRSVN